MHEIGQPLHSFDLDKISNIEVKTLPSKTNFMTLDGNQISLDNEDIMICSKSNPLCLAGIFGGLDSGVTNKTKNIFLESAIFNPISIRKSSKRHSIFTEASSRFERCVDPEMVIYALKRASILIKNDCPDSISSNVIKEDNLKLEEKKIFLRYDKINSISGKLIDKEIIASILNSLDVTIETATDEGLNVISPHYRVDVNREIDLSTAHKISEVIEQKIQENISGIEHATIHLEPFVKIPENFNVEDKETEEKIKNMLEKYSEIKKIGRILSLNFENIWKIDIDCSFDKDLSIEKVHDLTSEIEHFIRAKIQNSVITIHPEPN